MAELHQRVYNSFQVNTFIIHDDSNECVIVDPACYSPGEQNDLISFIEEHKLKPVLVLNTHCHIDHITGLEFVKKHFNIPFRAHKSEEKNLNSSKLMGDMFGFSINEIPAIDNYINDDERIKFGHSELQAFHVPGHSAGSIAFYCAEASFVLSGDALFAGSIGRTDLPGGDYDTLINSINNKLLNLDPETVVWPGHGNSTTIKKEKESNPFLNDYKT